MFMMIVIFTWLLLLFFFNHFLFLFKFFLFDRIIKYIILASFAFVIRIKFLNLIIIILWSDRSLWRPWAYSCLILFLSVFQFFLLCLYFILFLNPSLLNRSTSEQWFIAFESFKRRSIRRFCLARSNVCFLII